MSDLFITYSQVFGEPVRIHQERHDSPVCSCTRCGRPLKEFSVITGAYSGVELAYLGKRCIGKLS